jgi:hypothetical protein
MAIEITRRLRERQLIRVIAAVAVLTAIVVSAEPAMASTNCGVVTNSAGNRMRVKVVHGSVRCTTARSLGRRARLYTANDGVAGWDCYHSGYVGQSSGWWGGCTRGAKEVRFYKP